MSVSTLASGRQPWSALREKLFLLSGLIFWLGMACKPKIEVEEPASQVKGFSASSVARKLGSAIFSYGDYTQNTIRSVTKDWQTNIAAGKNAISSSVHAGFSPQKAVDGNTDGLLKSDSIAITAAEPYPWWQVDLGQDHAISAVTIWARTDCCTDDLAGATLEILDARGKVLTRRPLARKTPVFPAQGIPLDGVMGRYVKIKGAPNVSLSLAEVEVWEKALGAGQGVCWKRSQGRGVGTPLTTCSDPNPEKDGLLCYPKCKPEHDGNGPVCWRNCPEGYKDDGVFCRRPRPLRIIPQESYGRGAGRPMDCGLGYENNAGLCYPQCPDGMVGNGPVCWARCNKDYPVNCGAACGTSQAACTDNIKDMVLAPINAVANMATIVGSMGASTAIKTGARAALEGTQMVSKGSIGRAIAKTAMHAGSHASEGVAMELGAATLGEGEFEWQSLDPTGVADIVRAFSHPWCDEP